MRRFFDFLNDWVSIRATALVLIFLLNFSASPPPPVQPLPNTTTLGVPLLVQFGHYWCWAACTAMCMHYYHDTLHDANAPDLSECEIAKQYFIYYCIANNDTSLHIGDSSKIACYPDSIANEFDLTGVPWFQPTPGCKVPYYSYTLSPPPLTWQQLCDAFAVKKPVIFTWGAQQPYQPQNTLVHFMVAEGCSVQPSAPNYQWVSMNDPWPINDTIGGLKGRHAQTSYGNFANTLNTSVLSAPRYKWTCSGPDYVISGEALAPKGQQKNSR